MNHPSPLIFRAEILKRYGRKGYNGIQLLRRKGLIPNPQELTNGRIYWLRADIEKWLDPTQGTSSK